MISAVAVPAAARPQVAPASLPGAAPVSKKVYTYKQIVEKKETAKGIKDMAWLIQATEDPEERAILEACQKKLQANFLSQQLVHFRIWFCRHLHFRCWCPGSHSAGQKHVS